jgi:hypothetical protein
MVELKGNRQTPHYLRRDHGIVGMSWNGFPSSINITPKAKSRASNITISHHCITIAFSKKYPLVFYQEQYSAVIFSATAMLLCLMCY